MKKIVIEKLANGETVRHKGYGNSMLPIIKSGQVQILEPCKWEDTKVGDAVYCTVRSSTYTHLVKQKNDQKGCLIGNNHGRINGWTKKVYGRLVRVVKDGEE